MSLQAFWALFVEQPGQWLNALALFFSLAGGWLLLATRMREQRAAARVLASTEVDGLSAQAYLGAEPTLRLNRFFYRFGYACLGLALAVSWLGTRL